MNKQLDKFLQAFSSRMQNYRYRQWFIKYFFVFFLLIFAFRIINIHQLNAGPISVQEIGNKQAISNIQTKAQRGNILARNNDLLAGDLVLKKVNLDPTKVQTAFIPRLAKALIMPEKTLSQVIQAKLSKKAGRRNLVIKKNLRLTNPILANIQTLKKQEIPICRTKLSKNKLNIWDGMLLFTKIKIPQNTYKKIKVCKKEFIQGVALQAYSGRYYPKSASLAPLLGRVNRDKKGISGIEGEFEPTLSGQNGNTRLNFNATSKGSYFNPVVIDKLQHGQDIQLTIDTNIQFYTYSAIKQAVEKHQADSGSAIVLTPNGEILALVNYPADDPNDKTTYNAQNYRNRVLSDKVEPGSTIKPFTILLALDKNKISATEDELIDVTKPIANIKPDGKYQQMTVKKILQSSHNLGTIKIAERLDKKQLYNTWNKLGFGQPLGLIPNIENSGSLKHFSSWTLADKRSLAFGYGPMEANLAQLARAYLVFANDGAIASLKLVKNISADDTLTQVFSKKSTNKIARLLGTVVSNKGSGYRAQIKGYEIAGKTGTAEMVVDGVYNKKGAKRTFFAGFAPIQKPKYIMAIRLDYPKKCYTAWDPQLRNKCQGSNSAAMVFKNAMENILSNDKSIKLLAKK